MSISLDSLMNFGLRGLTQLARLVITLIVARFLGIADLGLYRMFSIYSDYAKQLNGLSFHTFLVRELHHHPREEWPALFSRTVRFHAVWSGLGLAIWIALFLAGLLPWWTAVAFLVTVASDILNTTIENYLVAAGRAVAAGVVLFIRQGLWVYLLALFLLVGNARIDLQTLLVAWSAGTVLAVISGLVTLWRNGLASSRRVSHDAAWERQGVKTGLLFTFVGFLLYVVTTSPTIILGMLATDADVGILTFFFTAFSTVGTLVYASVIALSLPALLAQHAEGDPVARDATYRAVVKNSLILTVVLTLAVAAILPLLVRIVNQPELTRHIAVALCCAIGGILFSLSQLPYLRLYVVGDDRGLFWTVGATAILSIALGVVSIHQWGLIGAAASLIANHAVLCLALLWRNRAHVVAGSD